MPRRSDNQNDFKRKDPACDFCRLRKLRCNRPLPCSSCTSRGIACQFAPSTTVNRRTRPSSRQRELSPSSSSVVGSAASHASSVQQEEPRQNLLSELQTLKRLTRDLEARILASPTISQPLQDDGQILALQATRLEPNTLDDSVTHLEHVSRSKGYQEPLVEDDVVIKIGSVQTISNVSTNINHLGVSRRCIWLPSAAETKILVNAFVNHINYVTPVINPQAMLSSVETIYNQLSARRPVAIGDLVLLLSVTAMATHLWNDDLAAAGSPFRSHDHAHKQATSWIKAAEIALDASKNHGVLCLATVQGTCILSFLVGNLEGASLRYRSLVSTGLMLSRELRLHRIDDTTESVHLDSVQLEMKRRVWWYLVTNDWMMSSRYGGPWEGVYQIHPQQMLVNKPRSISDIDLYDDIATVSDLNTSGCIESSYFFQRLRIAEISRGVADKHFEAARKSLPMTFHLVSKADDAIEQMIQELPDFLRMDKYESNCQSAKENGMFMQAYMITSMIHTHRCRLHFACLRHASDDSPGSSQSRSGCLSAAHAILRAEIQLNRSNSPFARLRFRLPAILYGLFLASIVLLNDACHKSPGVLLREAENGDLATALRLVEDAQKHSLAARNLHASLMQIISRETAENSKERHPETRNGAVPLFQMQPMSNSIYMTDDLLNLDGIDLDELLASI